MIVCKSFSNVLIKPILTFVTIFEIKLIKADIYASCKIVTFCAK